MSLACAFSNQASLCEDEGREKALAAKLDLEGKKAVLADAEKQLNAAREAVNDKHRELLKTTRNDPLKVSSAYRTKRHLCILLPSSIASCMSSHVS